MPTCFAFRSRLEYAFVVWCPYLQIHIDTLEKIQRCFLKNLAFKVDGLYPRQSIPHTVLLNRFGFEDLNSRRINFSLNFFRKLLQSQIDCPNLLSKICFTIPRLSSRTYCCEKHSPIYEMWIKCNQEKNDFDLLL